MTPLRFIAALSLLGVTPSLAACGSTTVSTTGPAQPPRGVVCDFQLLTALPGDGYTEIGTIDVNPGSFGTNAIRSLDSFKEKIQPYVCQVGGDAALALANGFGMYIKATVLKSGGPARSVSATAAGCQFDTQCKGDRVCVKGECEDPPKGAR